ncbi:MAG TPA: HAMP domain-containing sensor histidine kinase [Solirubrobacterales bacterium]|nr:HAMP domain-containing sensor histidine kinase [Solirubrobacterales bacterium]
MNSLFPRHWPVRWRIAAVSAGLTFLILLCFALIVGRLATDKINDNFRDDVKANADELSTQSQLVRFGDRRFLDRLYAGNDLIRVVDASGNEIVKTEGTPDLGPPNLAEVIRIGNLEVASQKVLAPSDLGVTTAYLQYAEDRSSVDATIDRLWLLLGLGVAGGTVLALLAGMAVAQRAMGPIASLTAAAREVTMTRDPSKRIPMPNTDDEVAELARTLDRMLQELDAARSETEQMVQAQRDFVADASHELRTPLTSVLANLELLETRLIHGDAEDAEIVAGALGSSRRMRRLVSDLLLLARADAGRGGPQRICDLGHVAEAAIAEVRAVSDGHPIALADRDSVEVYGNPDDLHRLVLNLVENAVRHTPTGTPIDVSVRAEDGQAVVEVSDAGPGIPDGLEEQIFARFVRGTGPADLAAGSGTGLGLAIVKAVAIAHGGTVDVGSSAPGGARFTVRMPCAAIDEQTLTKDPAKVS